MKKNKFIFIPLLLLTLLIVSSCSNSIKESTSSSNTFDNLEITESGENSEIKADENKPDYVAPSLNYNEIDDASIETAVEKTVKKVYNTTVSLKCMSASATSRGSGVLFSENEELGLSYIITCFHVIDGASKYEATLADGVTTYEAKLVGGNYDYDLAVLSIKATNLSYASFYSDSNKINLGSEVVCIGNPLGTLPGSVSRGVVSYINREIVSSTYNVMNLIQTDVAINSGNSGGALFNTSGALIGIVNAKYSSSGVEGLGFAIPINDVKMVINSVMSTAKYDKNNDNWDIGYLVGDWELGFGIADGMYGSYFNSKSVVYVNSISSNKTTSGYNIMKTNDIIEGIKVDYKDDSKTDFDIDISSSSNVLLALNKANLKVGDSLKITVTRNNSKVDLVVELVQYLYSI